MFINPKTKAYDGDYQIIFSDTFNVYENILRLTDIAGYNFELIFDKGYFVVWKDDKNLDFSDRESYPQFQLWTIQTQ